MVETQNFHAKLNFHKKGIHWLSYFSNQQMMKCSALNVFWFYKSGICLFKQSLDLLLLTWVFQSYRMTDGIHTCHVLILTPFIVLCIMTSRTVMFETQALVLSFPRLPMLIPCPGPQLTLCMYTFEHPVCIETQSSPAHVIQAFYKL